MALADYQTLVTSYVRDDAGKISNGDRDAAIESARQRYSLDRPRTAVEDLIAPAGNLLDLPAGWQAEFSRLVGIEFPIGSVPPAQISNEAIQLYQTPAALKIMLRDAPGAGATLRASYTIRHLLDAGNDTIPLHHRELVASLAAANALEQLAAHYSNESDSTIGADAVEHRSKAQEYAARARTRRQFYLDGLGIDPKRSAPAGTTIALEPRDSLGGPRLTHRLAR